MEPTWSIPAGESLLGGIGFIFGASYIQRHLGYLTCHLHFIFRRRVTLSGKMHGITKGTDETFQLIGSGEDFIDLGSKSN